MPDAIADVTSADDAESSKPAPDIVIAALERADARAVDAVFVGDSIWDAHAARKAGVVSIGVTCGGISRAELASAGMAQVYAAPADLVANFDRSLLAAH